MATKVVEMPPVSMLKEEDFHLKGYAPKFKPFDKTMTISQQNMNTNIHSQDRKLSPKSSKVFIKPMSAVEKVGPAWGISEMK